MMEGPAPHDTSTSAPALVFISHRHDDRELAARVTQTIRTLFGNRVDIFSTSGRDTQGVKSGDSLRPEIAKALHDAALVILLYTDPEADWSWCFFECGVAVNQAVQTKIVVIDFAEKDPPLFNGELRIVVETAPENGDSPGGGQVDLERFIIELGGPDSPIPNAEQLIDPELSKEDLRDEGERLYRDLWHIGPAEQARLTDELLKGFLSVPLMEREKRFSPLLTSAVAALSWGLREAKPVRDLFTDYWEGRFVRELTLLADRTLVFNPGRVSQDWHRLIDIAQERFSSDVDALKKLRRPVLCLVSGELNEPLKFWEEAQREGSDAYYYEKPVRTLANTLHEAYGDQELGCPLVKRVLILHQALFTEGPEAERREWAERLSTVASWFLDGHIDVSVCWSNDADEQWHDYGIVGDIAVSRFQSLRDTVYRSLSEEFSPETLKIAVQKWHELPARWQATGAASADDVLSALGGA